MRFTLKHSEKILNIVNNRDELTYSDLQGMCGAIVLNILYEAEDIFRKA